MRCLLLAIGFFIMLPSVSYSLMLPNIGEYKQLSEYMSQIQEENMANANDPNRTRKGSENKRPWQGETLLEMETQISTGGEPGGPLCPRGYTWMPDVHDNDGRSIMPGHCERVGGGGSGDYECPELICNSPINAGDEFICTAKGISQWGRTYIGIPGCGLNPITGIFTNCGEGINPVTSDITSYYATWPAVSSELSTKCTKTLVYRYGSMDIKDHYTVVCTPTISGRSDPGDYTNAIITVGAVIKDSSGYTSSRGPCYVSGKITVIGTMGACNPAATITGCPTAAVLVNSETVLTASEPDEGYEWVLTGGGSLSASVGNSVTYTAPASNPACANNAVVSLKCDGVVIDACDIAINQYTSDPDAHAFAIGFSGTYAPPQWCLRYINCNDEPVLTHGSSSVYCDPWYPDYETKVAGGSPTGDIRSAGMIAGGCCPLILH